MNAPNFIQRNTIEEDSNSPELDSQPEMVVSEDSQDMNYRDDFYPQYIDALPASHTHESRNTGLPDHNDTEPQYAQV